MFNKDSPFESSDEPVKMLGIGPLTNIAELIETQPTIPDKIERIFIMAGALRVKGDVIVSGFTDWNSYVDPNALKIRGNFGCSKWTVLRACPGF